MSGLVINPKDELVMKLLHYFITEEGYNPIIVHGSQNEIWLENLNAPYKIIRIMTGYIHNMEQLEFDLYKTKTIMGRIKRKTFSLKMNALSIFLDLGDSVHLESPTNIECINITNEKDINKNRKLIDVFPAISTKLKFVEDGIQLFSKITSEINQKSKEEAVRTEDIFKAKPAYITYALIIINILVFLWIHLVDHTIPLAYGALIPAFVRAGDYYRLLSAAFLHFDVFHIFFNMYALYLLGTQLESFYGRHRYIIIYLYSAIAGSLLSMTFLDSYTPSIGASGAVFGLLGALLYFGYHYRVYLGNAIKSRIIPIIILNLYISFAVERIDQYAHIGGLVGGIIIAMAVGVKYKTDRFEQINGIIVSILTILFLTYLAFIYVV
jgi:rhomboid protease GluP